MEKKVLTAEVLFIADCPNLAAARSQTERLLKEHGLSGVEEVEVPDRAAAQRLGFAGSPTIRINGKDVSTPPSASVPAFACRTYEVDGRLSGTPHDDLVRSAIRRALEEPGR